MDRRALVARSTLAGLDARRLTIAAAVGVACLLAGPHATTLLCALLSEFALREFLMRLPTRPADRRAISAAFVVALPLQYALVWVGRAELLWMVPAFYAAIVLTAAAMSAPRGEHAMRRAAGIALAVATTVCGLSHAAALATLALPGADLRHGALLAWLLLVALLADALQDACDERIGRHPIAPAACPGKTWEGLAAGAALACAAGAALHGFTPFEARQAAVLALAVVLAGNGGRLLLAAADRRLGTRARAAGVGARNGVLARLDAIAFSAPAFFFLVRFLFQA